MTGTSDRMQDELPWIILTTVAVLTILLVVVLTVATAAGCEQMPTGLIICEPGYTPILVA